MNCLYFKWALEGILQYNNIYINDIHVNIKSTMFNLYADSQTYKLSNKYFVKLCKNAKNCNSKILHSYSLLVGSLNFG